MKILFYFLLLFALTFPQRVFSSDQTPAERFDAANAAYNATKYSDAINTYNSLISDGYSSSELYYNMGNAFYRNNQIAQSIWCYEKCLLINPSHRDAQANLEFVNQTRLNEIETVPDNFFIFAWKAVYTIMSWKCWTFTFLITLVVFLALTLLFLLSASDKKRRLLFVGSCVMLVFMLLSLAQSISGYRQIHYTRNAIIMQEATSLKSAPDQTGTGIMVLQPGVKIRILECKTPWLKVSAPDGTQGWLPEGNIVRLNAETIINSEQ